MLRLRSNGTVANSTIIGNGQGGMALGTLSSYSRFGDPISPVGDLDLDGYHDIAVKAPDLLHGGPGHGAVFILFMLGDDTVKHTIRLSQATGEGFDNLVLPGATLQHLAGGGMTGIPLEGHNEPTGLMLLLHLDGGTGVGLI